MFFGRCHRGRRVKACASELTVNIPYLSLQHCQVLVNLLSVKGTTRSRYLLGWLRIRWLLRLLWVSAATEKGINHVRSCARRELWRHRRKHLAIEMLLLIGVGMGLWPYGLRHLHVTPVRYLLLLKRWVLRSRLDRLL